MGSRIFPSPMSCDSTDRLNHKWMLMLILLLALVAFIVPLHPIFNDNSQNTESPTTTTTSQKLATTSKPFQFPTYKAVCWAPMEFTIAMIAYANAYCAESYNAVIRGQNDTSVYRVKMYEQIPLPDEKGRRGDAITPDLTLQRQYQADVRRDQSLKGSRERVVKLVSYQAPVTLLLVAVCLGLSQAVWGFLTECFGSFNVAKTLEAASRQGKSGDTTGRKQIYEDISESVTAVTGSSPRILSCLYVFKKILSAVFVLALLVVVIQHALPEVEQLQDDLDKFSASSTTDKMTVGDSKDVKINNNNNNSDTNPTSDTTGSNSYDNSGPDSTGTAKNIFLCDFSIRQLQSIQRYTLQCLPVLEKDGSDTEQNENAEKSTPTPASAPQSSSPSKNTQFRSLLEFESMMFKITIAVLVVLLVSNIFSLADWICKLVCGPARTAAGLSSDLPADIVFLVRMARINASVEVAHALARGFGGVKV